MNLGTSYYPEITPESDWKRDLETMRLAEMTVLRIAEFAWSTMEPREGIYQFDWLDRFLDLARDLGHRVILCTPTATPPAWLTTQYPDMFIERRDGSRHCPGGRRDMDINHEIYRYYSVQIASQLGLRYGNHPAVIGWQIDNELIGPEGEPPESHSPATLFRFRQYLKRVHGDIATLNRRWGTRFWSQEYSDWGEVGTPRNFRSTMGQVLDYSRFFSESIGGFIQLQYQTLRPIVAQRQWISTNSTAIFECGLNHQEWAQSLDVAGWDSYFTGNCAYNALAHDLFRSAKNQPFWIFETDSLNRNSTPAFLAEMTAHGATAALVWHWRNHPANAESDSNTICDCAGNPDSKRVEFMQTLNARPELATPLPETLPRRKAAFLYCLDCARTVLTPDPYIKQRGELTYMDVVLETYRVLWQSGIAVDVVQPGADLEGYNLLVMPAASLLSQSAAEVIRQFVQRGGTLLGVAKTMHRDEWATHYPTPAQPLTDVLGFKMSRNLILRNDSGPIKACINGIEMDCLPYLEIVTPTTATIEGSFESDPATNSPAALINRFGKGQVFYSAACSPQIIRYLAEKAAKSAQISIYKEIGRDVSILPDLLGSGVWVFNHSKTPIEVQGVRILAGDFAKFADALA